MRGEQGSRRRACPAGIGLALFVLTLPGFLAAQEKGDPFRGALFDVELVMGNQEAVGLTSDQREEVVAALQRMQSAVVPSQLSLGASAERLLALLRQSRVDVEGALAEVGEVLRLENEVKIERVRFLIEVKNILTPEQHGTLERIRANG